MSRQEQDGALLKRVGPYFGQKTREGTTNHYFDHFSQKYHIFAQKMICFALLLCETVHRVKLPSKFFEPGRGQTPFTNPNITFGPCLIAVPLFQKLLAIVQWQALSKTNWVCQH